MWLMQGLPSVVNEAGTNIRPAFHASSPARVLLAVASEIAKTAAARNFIGSGTRSCRRARRFLLAARSRELERNQLIGRQPVERVLGRLHRVNPQTQID